MNRDEAIKLMDSNVTKYINDIFVNGATCNVINEIYDDFESRTCSNCEFQRRVECPLENLFYPINEDEYFSQDVHDDIEMLYERQKLTLHNSKFSCSKWEKKDD